MNLPSRFEIETLATEIFGAGHERRIRDFAQEEIRVLAKVRSTHNIGGHAPALVQFGAERLRSEVLTLSDAWVEAFTEYGVPSDIWAEKTLEKTALQMAGGTISRIREKLRLLKGRTRRPIPDPRGHLEREISASMNGALREGKLRLKRQRIKFKNSKSPVQPRFPVVNRTGGVETVALPRAMDAKSSMGVAGGAVPEATQGSWQPYRAQFEARLESLEAMAARADPLHLPLDEQDAQRFARNAAKQRFDELAEVEFRQWVDSGLPHETFSARLSELSVQVLTALAELWSLRSNILTQRYEKNCRLPAEGELGGKVSRWGQRARTTELVCHLSRDGGFGLTGEVAELATLISEEDQKVSSTEDKRRLRVHLYDVGHRFDGGYSGDFLERSRLAITSVGIQFAPTNGVSPLEFCLRMLFRELVCEREPLYHPQVARLNGEQVARYLWAAYSGNSTAPVSGEIRNPCEALRWYCQRLIGLLDSPDVVLRLSRGLAKIPSQESAAGQDTKRKRGRRRNQGRRDAVHNAIAKHGSAWRDRLSDVFEELEGNEVPLGDFQGREIDLGDGQNIKVWKWTDLDLAQGDQLKQIVDALRKYS